MAEASCRKRQNCRVLGKVTIARYCAPLLLDFIAKSRISRFAYWVSRNEKSTGREYIT